MLLEGGLLEVLKCPVKLYLRIAQKLGKAMRDISRERDRDSVASLRKGLQVLTVFSRQYPKLTITDVARLTALSAASARRSLLTLEELGYLLSDGKFFWMSPKTLLVANAFIASRPLPAIAQPLLDALSERTRESASLGQLLDHDAIIVARSTARRSLSTGLGIGSRLPGYCSAIGRVLLSSLPVVEAEALLKAMDRRALTPNTVTDLSQILGLLERCREVGWAESDGEIEIGVRSMALPVRDKLGNVVAAMSIAVRAERMSMADFQQSYIGQLTRARKTLEARLFPVPAERYSRAKSHLQV